MRKENFIDVFIRQPEISTAENCNLTVVISYHKDKIPVVPPIDDLLKPVEVLSFRERGELEGDYYRRIIDLTLDNLLPGEYLLNPITIPLYEKGILTEELKSEFIPLKVSSSLLGENVFIDDFEEASPDTGVSPIIGLLIPTLIILLLLCAFVFWKKKSELPFIEASDFDDRIRRLSDECDDRTFYSNLAGVIREYLDSSIFLSVQSQTTEEFVDQAASSHLLDDDMKVKLFSFLRKSDTIIFGEGYKETGVEKREIDREFCLEFVKYVNSRISGESGT